MQPRADKPVASYRENVAWRQQTVTLFSDRVDVHRSISLADEADWSCSLLLLAPQFQTGKRRGGLFMVGLALLTVWATVVSVLWQVSSIALDSPKAAFFWALPVFFATLALLGIAKRPYVVVHSADGAPLFTIMKNYPDGRHFVGFTDQLLSSIRSAHLQFTATSTPVGSSQNEPTPN